MRKGLEGLGSLHEKHRMEAAFLGALTNLVLVGGGGIIFPKLSLGHPPGLVSTEGSNWAVLVFWFSSYLFGFCLLMSFKELLSPF